MSASRLKVSTNRPSKPRVRKATVAAPNLTLTKAYRAGELIAEKYRLIELLGEGGMGAVWRAHNQTLDIDVAVKLIRAEEAEATDGERAGDRLLQEARAAARLGHPAIARVFDFGTSDRNDPFIVMEMLKGEDLAEALARRGRISATKAVVTMMPIAHALSAAHAKGIVHRDLKPENIFLARAEDGHIQPKLVDFGIAKIERAKSHRLTQTGTMLGSPIYMSPEQARGDDVDHLADVWAFCVVLYEMVTGRPPFEGKNYNALLYSIIADDPPPITSFGGGDDELWRILRRGLAKDPDQRWASVSELGIALAGWMTARHIHEDITGASVSAQWLRRSEAVDVLASLESERASLPPQPSLANSAGPALAEHQVGLPKSRLVLVAAISTLIGVGAVVALAERHEQPVAPLPEPAVSPHPVPSAAAALAPEVLELEELEKVSDSEDLGVDDAQQPDKASSGRPSKVRRQHPASKKPKLKNPFD